MTISAEGNTSLVLDDHRSTMPADYVAQACLALVCELETSLQAGQAALLTLDAGRTEQTTREQIRLHQALEAVLLDPPISAGARLQGEEFRRTLRQCAPELADKLYAAGDRVLHLARVQAALLRRTQEFLCVLANCIAGPQAVYGPPGAPTAR